MRVAVVDIGTNSTRLLIADVHDGRIANELARESRVTRLGQGVDSTGALAGEAMDRVFAVLDDYRAQIDAHRADTTTAVLTSAVRDAANGAEFTQAVRDRYGLDAHTIDGDEEAALTFLGATSERATRPGDTELAVVDIGGGSTEVVVGHADDVSFHVSMQVGVVRQTERHLHSDPPHPDELGALASEVRQTVENEVPDSVRDSVHTAIAVAGTATSAGAIDLCNPGREAGERSAHHDPQQVHGHRIPLGRLEELLARLAQMPNDDRRNVAGLHPDRAPTIVAGVAILIQVLRAFGLDEVEVSEHDVLRGAALRRSAAQ
jgi:exopolyphosphatase/guanosine-5'-triphosphate,3'-diphosphate pyrophosphatase